MRSHFCGAINTLVEVIVKQKLLKPEYDKDGQLVLEHYENITRTQNKTAITDPENKFWKGCAMERRKQVQTSLEDVQRYVDGFIRAMSFEYILGNTVTQDEKKVITSQLRGQLTAQLAYVLAQIYEQVFLEPLEQVATDFRKQPEETFKKRI